MARRQNDVLRSVVTQIHICSCKCFLVVVMWLLCVDMFLRHHVDNALGVGGISPV